MGHSKVFHPSSKNNDQEIINMNPYMAIEVIMDTYGDEIKRFIFTYMKNSADTDDVSQEVFVTVYEKLDTFQSKSSLRSWIYSIAINKCKDHLRSWQVRNKKLQDKMNKSPNTSVENNQTPEEHIVQSEDKSELLNQVLQLPIKYREVITLYYLNEFSVKETSTALNIREATVRTRLFRAREQLKERLIVERGGNLG